MLLSPLHLVAMATVQAAIEITNNHVEAHFNKRPYHDSALSGEAWVQELLNGHPRRIRDSLGVTKAEFVALVEKLAPLVHWASDVSNEEQLAIFLHVCVTGLPSVHVAERFQRAKGTITR
jgi:hypothetical protein